jgi:HEAT repeat protein
MRAHTADKGRTATEVERAVERLRSLNDGDLALPHVIVCGERAIEPLRKLLFEREPSGLFEARCRATEALAAIGARNVLLEFLRHLPAAPDPVEALGNDAVINAAALAACRVHDEELFEILLKVARRPALTGVIGALGSFGRAEAIPLLIDALEDDTSRLTAENALKRVGGSARPALRQAAERRLPSPKIESVSSQRRRQSASKLLAELAAA